MAIVATKIFSLKQGNLTIQSAQVIDAEEFLYVMRQYDNETDFLARSPSEFHMTLAEERKFIKSKLVSPKEILLIARLNGILVGTLGYNSSPLLRYCHKGSLGISIMKEYWGLGIGRKLIEALFEWADANGVVKITLEVDTLNSRAIYLYKSLGFIKEGLEKMDRRMENNEFRDSYLMARFNPYYNKNPSHRSQEL